MRSTAIFILAATIMSSCSKVDNYKAPDGHIRGTLTDKITGKPLQSQQPNGFTVQLFEEGKSANIPILVPGKADGSFENAFLFQGKYRVAAIDGAFFPVEPIVTDIGKATEVNFEVMPFLAVGDANVRIESGKVVSSYKILREESGGKILERRTLVSTIPTVNNVAFDLQAQTDLSGMSDGDILNTTFSDEVDGVVAGQDYYVRIAVRTENALGRYNYSEVFKVTGK